MSTNALIEQMKEWRHHLHMHPETAFEEVETASLVYNVLSELGLDVEKNIGGTGVVGTLKVGDGADVIALRADMDAIGMQETGDVPYCSKTSGKMHACGHDGHVATLLGAAKMLVESKDFNGTVKFLFQPAEEPGKGAQAMIDEGLFERHPINEIYGLHNTPFLPEGHVHTRTGGIMASEDNFTIKVKGQGSHASSPHLGIDPLVISAQIILALQSIVSRNASPLHQAVVSCTQLHTDGVHNAIPSNVEILGDTRSCTLEMRKLIETRMESICKNTCAMNGAECEFTYTHEFEPTVNWEECVTVAATAAKNVVGEEKVNANCEPWMASEDFGVFLRKIPGCLVFLGSGKSTVANENISLHNSRYDYNDDVLLTGAEFFAELIRVRLPK